MLIAIYWLACAFFCSYIAHTKRRGTGTWFVLGLLANVLALLALIALPARTAEEVAEEKRRALPVLAQWGILLGAVLLALIAIVTSDFWLA